MMNAKLQNLLDAFQQSAHLSADEKNAFSKTIKDINREMEIASFKLDRTEKVKKTTAILLEETIEELEQKRKSVESQNRELEIESALERVRTVAMSMNRPHDMLHVCRIISEQLELLKVKEIRNIQTAIFYEARGSYINYEFYAKHNKTIVTEVDYKNHPVQSAFANQMLKGPNEVYTHFFEGEQVKDWYEFQKTTNVFIDTCLENASSLNYYWYSLGPVALGISTYAPLNEDENKLFKRFLKVFELAYRRYLDIEKAEAQAKEARIEAALERVRSRTMGMQKSEELKEIIQVVYEQFAHVNIPIEHTGFIMDYKASDDMNIWLADRHVIPSRLTIPYFDSPHWNSFNEAKEKGIDFFANNLTYEEKNSFYQKLFEFIPGLPDETKEYYFSRPGVVISTVLLENVGLYIENYSVIPYTDEENNTLMRFGKVFQQTYTRFLDLQKAEAQAREAKIEVALERTRTHSMLMQHSSELDITSRVFHEQLLLLGIESSLSFVWLPDVEKGKHLFWTTWTEIENDLTVSQSKSVIYDLDKTEPYTAECFRAWESGEPVHVYAVAAAGVKTYFDVWSELLSGASKMKPGFFPEGLYYAEAFMKYGCFGIMCKRLPTEDEKKILLRFTTEFERTYTRFLDLQKAETQAREAQIELALERVRARTMAMQHSEELRDAASILFQQVQVLGITTWSCGYNIWEKDDTVCTAWMSINGQLQPPFAVPLTDDPTFIRFDQSRQKGEEFYVEEIGGDELKAHYRYLLSLSGVDEIADQNLQGGLNFPTFQINHVASFSHGNLLFITYEPVPEAHDIFKRFAKVFEQAYTRFMDLQKAEAQAREGQVQLALERVRARTMAMHHSDELAETSSVLFQQIKKLGFETWSCGFCVWANDDLIELWMGADSGGLLPPMTISYKEEQTHRDIHEAFLRGQPAHDKIWEGEDLSRHYSFLKTIPSVKEAIDILESSGLTLPGRQCYYVGFFKQGYLLIITKEPNPELRDLSKRFAQVFDITYTRFIDLQRAEAQAKEATIEAALERVRASAMAMHSSEGLFEVTQVLREQSALLGEKKLESILIHIYNEESDTFEAWYSYRNPEDPNGKVTDGKNIVSWTRTGRAASDKKKYYSDETDYTIIADRNMLTEWYNYLNEVSPEVVEHDHEGNVVVPDVLYYNYSKFPGGALLLITNTEASDSAKRLLRRSAKVFNLAYTRFLDLQKAEAQAKEARIEAALERVRSRSLAMHQSDEIKDVVKVVVERINALDIEMNGGVSLVTFYPGSKDLLHWIWIPEQFEEPFKAHLPYFDNIVFNDCDEAREKNLELVVKVYSGEEKENYFRQIFAHTGFSAVAGDTKAWVMAQPYFGFSFAIQQHSGIFLNDYTGKFFSHETNDILLRFSKVFEQSFIRFLDLQKAEAQARESNIEAALERVRSRTLAMQKSDELAETAAVLFKQLILLGIEPNRLYISIIKNEQGETEFWITDEDGSTVSSAFESNLNENSAFKKMYSGWKQKKKSLMIDMKGKELAGYFRHLGNLHVPFKDVLIQKRRVQYIAYFNKGFIGMASPDVQPKETVILLERFAAVFNLTFIRFNDLKVAEAHAIQAGEDLIKLQAEKRRAEDALTELQVTQKQLIQSEKMASLGELTAGIAHEIQNPLNFVNNFSEVSKELLDEMKTALDNGNENDAIEIANDVIQNLEKINHHGKRADAIVKGMLQHSRPSTRQKEAININTLCDEYIRLCYHGLRAKENSFNAAIKTDFDTTLQKINIIPQDIGRVLLNVLTNAFYAVSEKSKNSLSPGAPTGMYSYKATVSIQTKKVNDKVEIRIEDNGNGIPGNIADKIFQPFFTTKPTGQGTGLGLSLSYDIIKAHDGEIKAETREGEGSTFIIQLPILA